MPAFAKDLLPIRGVILRLRFSGLAYAPFYHQPQLKPFLKELLQDKQALDNENGLWVEACESGRTQFKNGDEYRFILFCTASAYPLFVKLLDRIRRLPGSYPKRRSKDGLFADNLQFIGLIDYFTQQAITSHDELFPYDAAALQREMAFWQDQNEVILRFTSPARFKIAARGKPPYIRDRGVLQVGDTERRIYRALCNLSPAVKTHCDVHDVSYQQVSDRLFWTDNAQTLKSGKLAPFGGVLGDITLSQPVTAPAPHLPLLILGQYIGIGERRSYGLGRYRLETAQGQGTTPPRQSAASYQQRCAAINNLELACYNIARKHPWIRKYIDPTLHEFDPEIEEQLNPDTLLNSINLQQLSQSLADGSYQASALQGVILRQPGRHPRPLCVPPLEDRIAQRAVVEVMSDDIDQLSTIDSYGYRKGKSRMQARDKILALNRQGYEWFFEADIQSFFDLVSHDEIENRLNSFFPDEPLSIQIMQWLRAPVRFEGETIQRQAGLPQGSPVSPMLANLLLEDFDADLEAAGMKLLRFADDFVILCKNRKQAEAAAKRARHSLQELGLDFNEAKTRMGKFSQGFKFLGYTFLEGYAIESYRNHETAAKLKFDDIPAASWLAKLLSQQPQKIQQLNNRLDKKRLHNEPASIFSSPAPQALQQALPSNELGATLFVTQPIKQIRQHNGLLQVLDSADKQVLQQIGWNELNSIVLIGRHAMTQPCLLAALKQGVSIHYCTEYGHYQGMSTNRNPSQEGPELWLRQTTIFQPENPQALQLARILVDARIHNQIEVIRQRIRHDGEPVETPINAMLELMRHLQAAQNFDQIRGYEGQAAALYFKQLAQWVPPGFKFNGRNKRPSTDPFNALLSLGFTILYSHTSSILQIAGLYPWQGFYHQPRGRHQALASDMMEVFRHLVERTALTLLRSGQLKENDFYHLPDGACRLTREAIKIYLTQLNARMLKPVTDKSEQITANMHEHLLRQANQLIRKIRGQDQPVHFFKIK